MTTTTPVTLSDRVRIWAGGILQPVARRLHHWHVHPDVITIIGTLLVAIAAFFIATDNLFIGGVFMLIGLPLDALDGAVARLRDAPRSFGAFLDSTLDRYADGMIFGAFVYLGATNNNDAMVLLALTSLTGAYLISYTRARAEGLGIECKIGLFSRFERTVVVLILLFTGLIVPMLAILAAGTHFTALQRIWHVHQKALHSLA